MCVYVFGRLNLTGSICVCGSEKLAGSICVCMYLIGFICVCGSEKLAGSMCVHVFGSLFEQLLNLTKKKRLLERNDEGQGKIFDMFFGIDVEFDPKKKKKWFAGKKLYKWLWCFKIPTNVQLYMPGICNY